MTSKEINDIIRGICDEPEKYGYECFGGKTIPYIGSHWRDVDFDWNKGIIGVMDDGSRGFMQNNKWDFQCVECPPHIFRIIKDLILKVCANPCKDTLKDLNEFIQSYDPNEKEGR